MTDDLNQRQRSIFNTDSSMLKYYAMMEFNEKSSIYCSYMDDIERGIISRWRLSNHRLKIETGRYTIPTTPRAERTCNLCSILEDECHVIFVCPLYSHIRQNYRYLFQRISSINNFLNPSSNDAKFVAKVLLDIEACRYNLGI